MATTKPRARRKWSNKNTAAPSKPLPKIPSKPLPNNPNKILFQNTQKKQKQKQKEKFPIINNDNIINPNDGSESDSDSSSHSNNNVKKIGKFGKFKVGLKLSQADECDDYNQSFAKINYDDDDDKDYDDDYNNGRKGTFNILDDDDDDIMIDCDNIQNKYRSQSLVNDDNDLPSNKSPILSHRVSQSVQYTHNDITKINNISGNKLLNKTKNGTQMKSLLVSSSSSPLHFDMIKEENNIINKENISNNNDNIKKKNHHRANSLPPTKPLPLFDDNDNDVNIDIISPQSEPQKSVSNKPILSLQTQSERIPNIAIAYQSPKSILSPFKNQFNHIAIAAVNESESNVSNTEFPFSPQTGGNQNNNNHNNNSFQFKSKTPHPSVSNHNKKNNQSTNNGSITPQPQTTNPFMQSSVSPYDNIKHNQNNKHNTNKNRNRGSHRNRNRYKNVCPPQQKFPQQRTRIRANGNNNKHHNSNNFQKHVSNNIATIHKQQANNFGASNNNYNSNYNNAFKNKYNQQRLNNMHKNNNMNHNMNAKKNKRVSFNGFGNDNNNNIKNRKINNKRQTFTGFAADKHNNKNNKSTNQNKSNKSYNKNNGRSMPNSPAIYPNNINNRPGRGISVPANNNYGFNLQQNMQRRNSKNNNKKGRQNIFAVANSMNVKQQTPKFNPNTGTNFIQNNNKKNSNNYKNKHNKLDDDDSSSDGSSSSSSSSSSASSTSSSSYNAIVNKDHRRKKSTFRIKKVNSRATSPRYGGLKPIKKHSLTQSISKISKLSNNKHNGNDDIKFSDVSQLSNSKSANVFNFGSNDVSSHKKNIQNNSYNNYRGSKTPTFNNRNRNNTHVHQRDTAQSSRFSSNMNYMNQMKSMSSSTRVLTSNSKSRKKGSITYADYKRMRAAAEPQNDGLYENWITGDIIGKGAFGTVYKGYDKISSKIIAIKEFKFTFKNKKKTLFEFDKETKIMKKLKHLNIVEFYNYKIDNNKKLIYLIMEYVPGNSLELIYLKNGSFSEIMIQKYVYQIINGLNYAHNKNIIHRDIKGKNILIDNKGTIKICDFGSAVLEKDNKLKPNSSYTTDFESTPLWTAPECLILGKYSFKIDVWSTGCVIIEMATAKKPWNECNFTSTMNALFHIGNNDDEDNIPKWPKSLSIQCQNFIKKCLTRDPNKRYNTQQLLNTDFLNFD